MLGYQFALTANQERRLLAAAAAAALHEIDEVDLRRRHDHIGGDYQ